MDMKDEKPAAAAAAAAATTSTTSTTSTSSYVTYGMLQKNHEFVDWVRVDLEEDEKVRVQNAATSKSSHDGDSFRDMDERAFERLRTQWQEISAADASNSNSSNNGNNGNHHHDKSSRGSIKQLLASASAKTLSPDSISYGVFDTDWNPVKLIPRHSNVDVAILLHVASEEGKKTMDTLPDGGGGSESKRTYLTETLKTDPQHTHSDLTKTKVSDGILPIVPVRRSTLQQTLIKQSVHLFFRKDSIQFFACFPLRYSARTIYRFDMVHGGIDRKFWQKAKDNTTTNTNKSSDHGDEKTTMNSKLADIRSSFASKVSITRGSFASKVSITRGSLLTLTSKKNSIDEGGKDDGKDNTNAEKTTMPAKMSLMKMRMSNNAANVRNSFALRVSTTKDSLLKKNNKDDNEASPGGDGGNEAEAAAAEAKTKMPAKLSTMKKRMSSNTAKMRNSFASKVSATKQSFLNVKNKKNDDSGIDIIDFEDETSADVTTIDSEGFSFTIDDTEDDESGLVAPSISSVPAGYFALTIDDAPCRFDDRSHSQMENVLDLLKRYDAKATFMVISSFLADCHEPDMIRLLLEGHELANHGVRDEPMDKMATSVEIFVDALDECNTAITDLQKKAKATGGDTAANIEIGVKWFRAPQAKYTKIMEEGIVLRDMHNVMCDAYAACPIVEDGPWIASALGKQIRNGSIAILHMPEKCGFREYCLEALGDLLEELCTKRNFKAVTIGQLQQIAEASARPESPKEETTIHFDEEV